MTDHARTVCVFCSASERIAPRYLELASEVGEELARRGLGLVSGGGRVSSMGAMAASARRLGARTVGVIPEQLVAWEVADEDADELVVTVDMRARKAEMDRRADAFLSLPGGIGTLEEFFEAWVGRTLGMHRKPLVVLDPWGDFAALHSLIAGLVDGGFVSPGVVAEVHWSTSVAEAFDLLDAAWASGEGRDARLPPRPIGRPDEVVELEAD